MDRFIQKMIAFGGEHQMFSEEDHILVALSGGPDSTALLYSMIEIRKQYPIQISIAHLNHCARGQESFDDSEFVRKLGEELCIPTFIQKINIEDKKVDIKSSFQDTARQIRKDYLMHILKKIEGNKIALGHNKEDQAETILMNFLRGSGIAGLKGMLPKRGPWIRPLLIFERSEVLEFLENRKISYRVDSSNKNRKYLRNKIRLDLVPLLMSQYNPNLNENLLRMSTTLSEENEFLDGLAEKYFNECLCESIENEKVILNRELLREIPKIMQRRVLRKSIQFVKGNLRRITFHHLQKTVEYVQSHKSAWSKSLPDNIEVSILNTSLEIKKIPDSKSDILILEKDLKIPLEIPGITTIPQTGIKLQTKIISSNEFKGFSKRKNEADLDLAISGENILIRFFEKGDRFIPFGMSGTKKLKDFFIDEKVPQKERYSVPLLTTLNGDIIWVYGFRISHKYRVTPETNKILNIKGLVN